MVYSSHDCDPLNDGKPHDAFSVFRVLECGGDFGKALKIAKGQVKRPLLTASVQVGSDGLKEWEDPIPIIADEPPLPYPIHAFPDAMQDAIREVQDFIQAPLPLVGPRPWRRSQSPLRGEWTWNVPSSFLDRWASLRSRLQSQVGEKLRPIHSLRGPWRSLRIQRDASTTRPFSLSDEE